MLHEIILLLFSCIQYWVLLQKVSKETLNNSIAVDCRLDSQRLATGFAGRPENASAIASGLKSTSLLI